MANNLNDEPDLTATYEYPREDASDEGTALAEVDPSDVPAGSITEVVQWVSDDKVRAAAALDAEQAKGDDARVTLVETLERLVD